MTPLRVPGALVAPTRPATPLVAPLLAAWNPMRALVALGTTVASMLVLVLVPGGAPAYAADLGPLRQPGQAAFIAAHRGDRAAAPENTIPAIEAAIKGGSDFVEADVQLSADGHPVLIHDDTVDRTTDGTGAVADLTLAELRALDAGSWYADRFAGTLIPTFDEFLGVLTRAPHVTALVELKGDWTAAQLGPLVTSVYFHGVQSRIVFASFSTQSVTAAREAAPAIPRIVIRRHLPTDSVGFAERYDALAIMTRSASLRRLPDAVEQLHAAGVGVLLYTLNSEERWSEALAFGVDGIVTDEPSELDEWIAATAPGT